NLFYDRRFDCAPPDSGPPYPSKLDFQGTHFRIVDLIAEQAKVLELGSGTSALGVTLKEKTARIVNSCDTEQGALTKSYYNFFLADLNKGLPEVQNERFDYILALDVIDHLFSPEDFLDKLRELSARTGAQVILTTANIGFIIMRLSLILGRFEYSKRGILGL